LEVPFLGEVPLVQAIRENADDGTPIVTDTSSPVGAVFSGIAERLVQAVEERNALRPATRKIDILHGK
jgi:ATP-binding protein involved in chromosome partitioning